MNPLRRVVITGASSGIGQAIARRFCSEGAVVVNLDIQDGSATAAQCGPQFHTVRADMADPDSLQQAFVEVDRILQAPPDGLVCCAAISKAQPFFEVDLVTLDQMLAINVRGSFVVCQQAAQRMRQVRKGHIIIITSVAAVSAWATEPVYGITKAAQMGMVQALAIELAPFGIVVNGVGPGPIEKPPGSMAHTRTDPEVLRHDLEHTPLARFGTAEEVAQAVALLSEVSWMTGQTLYVDGGFLATGLAYFGNARAALLQE